MQAILRSLLRVGSSPDLEGLTYNFNHIIAQRLEFPDPEDRSIFEAVKTHMLAYREAPSIQDLRDRFSAEGNAAALHRLDDVEPAMVYVRSSFESRVARKIEEQRKERFHRVIQESAQIATTGMKFGREVRQGLRDAISHITREAHEILRASNGSKAGGDITKDGKEFLAEVEEARKVPGGKMGCVCCLDRQDEVCRGLKRGELHIHAAFSGGLKTTYALNWAYKTAVYTGRNAFYYSLEMTYEHCRAILFAMHTAHWRFQEMGYAPLDYGRIRDGLLTDEEMDFLRLVVEDLDTNPSYGVLHVERPLDEVTIPDIRFTVESHHRYDSPVHILFIDYLQLVKCHDLKLTSTTERQNVIARASKELAMNFDGGAGLPVVGLWQINTEGYKAAQKSGGAYEMIHLSWAPEARNAADVITYTYVDDEMQDMDQALVGNMKNRDNPRFKAFRVRIRWPQRRLGNLVDDVTAAISSAAPGEPAELGL